MLPQIRFASGHGGYSPDAGEWGVTKEVSGNSKFETSGITQPPNPGFALWQVYENAEHKQEIIPSLERFYPGLRKYHDFLLTERDPKKEGLASVFHPWATGSDNTPCYDEAIQKAREWLAEKGFEQRIKKRKDAVYVAAGQRPKEKDYEVYGRMLGLFVARNYDQKKLFEESPFVVQDVLLNTILKKSLTGMARIAEVLVSHYAGSQQKTSFYKKEFSRNKMLALKVQNAIREKLYDKGTGLFYSYDMKADKLITVPTVHSFGPLLGNIASKEQASELIRHLKSEQEFSPKEGFMVPSVPLNSKNFNGIGYARGPIWPVRNWFVAKGLKNYDKALAEKVRKQTIELIAQGHKDLGKLKALAAGLMKYNSLDGQFTVPSRTQYCHGWLWDSGFAAIGWSHVRQEPDEEIWRQVDQKRKELGAEGIGMAEAREITKEEFGIPLFDEYFTPIEVEGKKAGSPLGSDKMTWTAALFLDLVDP